MTAPKQAPVKPAAPAVKPTSGQPPKPAPSRRKSSGTSSARDGVRRAQATKRRATQPKRKDRRKGGKKPQ